MEKRILLEQLRQLETAEPTNKITTPIDVVPILITRYGKRKQENFIVITLDGAHNVIKKRVVSKGLVNRTLVHPREIFRPAISDNAVAIIIAHNHPSGSVKPSRDDDAVTKAIREAGEIVGIRVLDHIVFSGNGNYYSYLEDNKL